MADEPAPPPAPTGQDRLVPVFTPGLGVRMVKASEAPAVMEGGSRFATQGEYHGAKIDSDYGGIGGSLGAAGYGAARGLGGMFGVPTDRLLISGASTQPGRVIEDDPFLGHIDRSQGDVLREKLHAYKDLHPYASAAGELAGVAAGTYLGGGIVGRVGSAIGTLAGRGVIGGIASASAEGALYSAGQRANEAAIDDEDLTAEKVIAAAGHGALMGAGVGAAFEAGGSALRSVGRAMHGSGAEAAEAAEASAGKPGSVGDWLEKRADVNTIKALGGSAGDIRGLERSVEGGYRRVAQDIRTDLEASTGKSIGRHTRESLNEYAERRVDELGDKLGGMLKKLDETKTGIAPDAQKFANEVRRQVIEPNLIAKADGTFAVLPGKGDVVHAAEKWLGEVTEAFGEKPPTFSAWQQARIGLDKQIKFEAARVSPAQDALRTIRGIMEDELTGAGESAAQQMGESFRAEYQATKSLYQSVLKARDLTERGVSRELVNNSLGLTSRMAGTVMGATGLATGGPVGGLISGGLATLAGKVIQDRGDQLAADLLSRASGLMGVRRVAAQAEATMARDVDALLKPANDNAPATLAAPRRNMAPFGIALTGEKRKDFERISSAVTQAQANPAQVSGKLGAATSNIADHSPKVASAMVGTALRGLDFLATKLPPSRFDQYTLQPQLQPGSRASDAEISRFMRYSQAVADPLVVLREAKKGTLTRDHVEAVKAVYPKLYGQIQTGVMQNLVNSKSKSELPYARRIQLGILLDIPTDKTLAPDFLQAIQATYSSDEKAGAESPPPTLSRPINVAGSVQTATQAAVEGTG